MIFAVFSSAISEQNLCPKNRENDREWAYRKKKVLIFIDSLERGGTEMGILRNVPVLRQKGWCVSICAFSKAGLLVDLFEKSGVPLYLPSKHRPTSYMGQLLYKAYSFIHAAITLWKQQPDILHCFLPKAYFFGSLAAFITRFQGKLFYTRPCLNDYQKKHFVIGWFERHVLHRYVDKAIGNARPILQQLAQEGVAPEKHTLLYNGVDPTLYAKKHIPEGLKTFTTQHTFLMTVVANLHFYKGHHDLLEALYQIRQDLPEKWGLIFAGRNEKNTIILKKKIASSCFQENVHFIGEYDDIPSLLRISHLHIHPSHQEGLPNSVIEAAFSGCPIIATDVGGTNEIIQHQKSGLLVPPQASAHLGQAIQYALKHPGKMKKMGKEAKTYAQKNFTLDKSVLAYQALYT